MHPLHVRSSAAPAFLLLLALSLPAPVRAAWPHDPHSGNVPVSRAFGYKFSPMVVSDGAGGAIIAWLYDVGGAGYDIYAQRVDATGTPLWTADGVPICTAAGNQVELAMIEDGAGGAILSWSDGRSPASAMDVYAQRVSAAGVVQWAADGVAVCTEPGDQYTPALATDGAGGAIVAWEDHRTSDGDIYAQRVHASGVPQWAAGGVLLCGFTELQTDVRVASDGAGGAIACWTDFRNLLSDDIYAQRVNPAGVPQWPAGGIGVCVQNNSSQFGARLVSDGLGGALVAWVDTRSANYDIYAQRLSAAGSRLWGTSGNGGVVVCQAASIQHLPTLCSDGYGGAIIAWEDWRGSDGDVYVQRMSGGGIPMWASNGVVVCSPSGTQRKPAIISDAAGGAVIAWQDDRYGPTHVFAQRLNSAGNAVWFSDGAALSLAAVGQTELALASDGAGGAIAAWEDYRSTVQADIYAQRIERFGMLGNPEPVIVQVRDVRNDQGGRVEVQWTASYLDVATSNPIESYWVWRQVPTLAAESRLQLGAALYEANGEAGDPPPGALRTAAAGGQIYYWEYLGSQPARGYPGYSYTAATLSDSVPGSNPYTRFMVEAQHAWSGFFWSSAPDSGYSVDNLPPNPPAPVAGTYSGGTASLHWGANSESDLANYRLYRGTSASFTPSPSNLVAAPTGTAYNDPAGTLYWYKLSAVDLHGNESGFTTLLPGGTADADDVRVARLALGPPSPNPARAATRLHFTLTREGAVSLSVYDTAGRRIRVLVEGVLGAGEHALTWNLRDDAGREVGAGLYFARLEAEGQVRLQRIAATR